MSTPEAVQTAPKQPVLRRHTLLFLVVYYLLAVVWGVRNVHSDQRSPLDWVVAIGLALALIVWAFIDIRVRRLRVPLLVRAWFVLGYFVVVPGYVIWSRGWRGFLWVVLHFVLWNVASVATMFVVGLTVYGEQWLLPDDGAG